MKKRIIQISIPSTGKEEWEALKAPIDSGWLTQGPKVAEFEKNFAKRHNVLNAIAVTSCTSGLHLALKALLIGPGDEVIVPAFTWVSTANAVLYCGAKPVFVDVLRHSFTIDPSDVAKKISKKTKAIILVHLFGICADFDAIKEIIPTDVKIIEDAACAAGSTYKGISAGAIGDVAAFSFHPRKSITTGEGGMVTTNNEKLARLISQMRNHGATISEEERHLGPKPYILPDFNIMGFNYRMTDLQGALGNVQLKKLDGFLKERIKWAAWYNEKLSDIDCITVPHEISNSVHSWQSFVLYICPKKSPMPRNRVMEILKDVGIATRPGTHAVHMLSFYREKFAIKPNDFPIAMDCDQNTMAIPLHNMMDAKDYEYVVYHIKKIFEKCAE